MGGCLEMHKDDQVVLREYPDELSARVAALSLEANGIPAQLSADTAGGALPSLALVFPKTRGSSPPGSVSPRPNAEANRADM